jgi:hypothetical protein
MKVIIAGSRDITDYLLLASVVSASGFDVTEVVSGGARGIDALGELWAENFDVPVKRFLADWTSYGKAAGPIRNKQMAEYADALIAISTGGKGTTDMIKTAKQQGLKVFVHKVEK